MASLKDPEWPGYDDLKSASVEELLLAAAFFFKQYNPAFAQDVPWAPQEEGDAVRQFIDALGCLKRDLRWLAVLMSLAIVAGIALILAILFRS